ncbi:putative TFIIH and nucleotide excision repair factor 3 complexes subunit [Byssothecium circinans]|uniref:RNA polymerase II transcription factor B subunit 2 n=1 Tax=Byssothecium circinans TaxID=147558 RepID=A0A6A5U7L6_9PLEO|nr:putative TFIIH and nucleotide excision repair factor 3 complexes subunit [Byssothecium circinans]
MSASSSQQALDYLEQLPVQTHKKLYDQPSTVLAVFRCMLPHLAKSVVMGMLYMPTPISSTDLNAWFRPSAEKLSRSSLQILEKLHIITQKQTDASSRSTSYSLAPGFARSLRQALEGSGSHRSFGVPAPPTAERKVSIQELDEYARTQWESILFYMVGSTVGFHGGGTGKDIGKGTRSLLEAGDFVGKKMGGQWGITSTGFMFVLQDTNAQVWSLLIEYLKHVNQLGMSETDVLSFLFMLGSLELGQDYSTSTLSPTQLQMLEDLTAFGLVYRTSANASTFYPTRLATTLTSDSGALSTTNPNEVDHHHAPANNGGATAKGFIIVETNYRIYAYTSSLLQIAVLSLFCKLTTRFPNLVSGKLTRASISRAVQTGISADQILTYLDAHAHPQMQKSVPFLPPTVTDQIRLWELEGERLECTDGYMLKEFPSERDYRESVKYAEDLGVLVWKDDAEWKFFVDRIEQMQEHLKKTSQRRPR